MASAKDAKPQDLETALVTVRDLGQLAKAAAVSGGTVPNGVKVISALVLQHVTSTELVLVAVNALHLVLNSAPHAPAMFRLEGGVKAAVAILVRDLRRDLATLQPTPLHSLPPAIRRFDMSLRWGWNTVELCRLRRNSQF